MSVYNRTGSVTMADSVIFGNPAPVMDAFWTVVIFLSSIHGHLCIIRIYTHQKYEKEFITEL